MGALFLAASLQGAAVSAQEATWPYKSNWFTDRTDQAQVERAMQALDLKVAKQADGNYLLQWPHNGQAHNVFLIPEWDAQGNLWNLRLIGGFDGKDDQFDELMALANSFNGQHPGTRAYVYEGGKARVDRSYPVQYGLNLREFEVNFLNRFRDDLFAFLDMAAAAQ